MLLLLDRIGALARDGLAWSVDLCYSLCVRVCARKTAEPIEMSFSVLTRVLPSNHVIDGGQGNFFWGGGSPAQLIALELSVAQYTAKGIIHSFVNASNHHNQTLHFPREKYSATQPDP